MQYHVGNIAARAIAAQTDDRGGTVSDRARCQRLLSGVFVGGSYVCYALRRKCRANIRQ
jgi:hypothetical protein